MREGEQWPGQKWAEIGRKIKGVHPDKASRALLGKPKHREGEGGLRPCIFALMSPITALSPKHPVN